MKTVRMIANGISANKYVNDKSNAVSDNSATNLSASANNQSAAQT